MYRQSVASEYETKNDASNSEFVNVSNSKETNTRDAKPVLTAILSKMEGKNEALPAWASFESYGPSFVYDSTMSPETRFVSLSLTDRRNIKTDAMKSKKDPNFIESVSKSYEYKKKCICGKYYPSDLCGDELKPEQQQLRIRKFHYLNYWSACRDCCFNGVNCFD